MSYTEMVALNKKGDAYFFAEVKNAWRGAMAIWQILEEKYLPTYRPSFVPDHIPNDKIETYIGFKPSRCSWGFMDETALKEIWGLFNDERATREDKIVLGTTFDRVVVFKENFEEVIEAFEKFEGKTTLLEQSKYIKEALKNEGLKL